MGILVEIVDIWAVSWFFGGVGWGSCSFVLELNGLKLPECAREWTILLLFGFFCTLIIGSFGWFFVVLLRVGVD